MSNKSFDHRPAPGATIEHLDMNYFTNEYVPSAIDSEVLRQNMRTQEERLASLRFLFGKEPTYGAAIIFGNTPCDHVPGSYLQFLRIDGTELGDPIKDHKELAGPLFQIVRQLDVLLELNVTTALDFVGGSRQREVPDYPIAALQQLVRNALIHRNYETSNAPVRLYWFNDRVEIHNPGGLFGQVTRDNFGTGVTDYRNPLIAEAMAHLGYVQRFGYGIPTAKRLLNQNGNPEPEFEFQQSAVLAIVRHRS